MGMSQTLCRFLRGIDAKNHIYSYRAGLFGKFFGNDKANKLTVRGNSYPYAYYPFTGPPGVDRQFVYHLEATLKRLLNARRSLLG